MLVRWCCSTLIFDFLIFFLLKLSIWRMAFLSLQSFNGRIFDSCRIAWPAEWAVVVVMSLMLFGLIHQIFDAVWIRENVFELPKFFSICSCSYSFTDWWIVVEWFLLAARNDHLPINHSKYFFGQFGQFCWTDIHFVLLTLNKKES